MIRFWPNTIWGRTSAVLVLGLMVVGTIMGVLLYVHRQGQLETVGGWHAVNRIAKITSIIDQTPANQRLDTLGQYQGPTFQITWTPTSTLPPIPLDWRERIIKDALQLELGAIEDDALRIGRSKLRKPDQKRDKRWGHAPDWRGPSFGPGHDHDRWSHRWLMVVSLRLDDGSWINFATQPPPIRSLFGSRFFGPGAGLLFIVVILAVWASRRATKPFDRFTQAAERLGLDVNAEPLDEKGPREVRRAAKAFNTMQARLQAFIKDRTHMLAAISHDLRTPITRLKLRAEFIGDEQQRAKMLADLDEMEAMIAATLTFARDDAANEPTSTLDLSALICELAENTQIKTNLPEHCTFTGRPIGLKRMIANVLGNAERFAENAEITLSCRDEDITITLVDDGPGIPEDMLECVFDPFVRVEGSRSRETGGTGLGLSAVRSIAHAHGGQVTLSNRPEGGLQVEITLPRF
ncbi:ATP-binding protein [Magnetovibrio sp. PR-2]|uniref:ATP-binding protein n=1 Tax=Magnetovibrio sp. PR-2 TaxID=3120356 RepID=UPI002FCE3446